MSSMLFHDIRVWMSVLGLASELAITISHVVIAVSLFRLKADTRPAYRTLGLLALLASLCAFREVFGVLETWRVATEAGVSAAGLPGFSTLKTLAAIFWVVTACRLPAVLRALSHRQAFSTQSHHPDEGDHQEDLRKSEQLANEMNQLSLKSRMLQNFSHKDIFVFDKFDTPQDIIIPRDDVEMIQCPI